MNELPTLPTLGEQCSKCSFYKRIQSLEKGFHSCSGFYRISPDVYGDKVKCQIGPVGGRRLGEKPADPPPAPKVTQAATPPAAKKSARKRGTTTPGGESTGD